MQYAESALYTGLKGIHSLLTILQRYTAQVKFIIIK